MPGMSRVPNIKTAEQEARRFLDDFDGQVAALELRDYVYAWTTDEDEIPDNAIIVGIGGTSVEMLLAGLPYVEPTASIYWSAAVTAHGVFSVGTEPGPWNVPEALARAHFLRQRMGYERVVVTMEEAGIWRPEYGRLAEREGL